MHVGILSDTHANQAALDAVLRDMPPVDLLLFCGDAVGYYAEPNEVCDTLRGRGAVCVRGNHDAYVLGALEPDAARRAAYRTDWTRAQLRPDNLEWLAGLPVERRIEIELPHDHPAPCEPMGRGDLSLSGQPAARGCPNSGQTRSSLSATRIGRCSGGPARDCSSIRARSASRETGTRWPRMPSSACRRGR